MIVINVKFKVKPEYADTWIETVASYTESTRAEPGNLWFDWFRSVDDPTTFLVIEAFADDGAAAHVTSEYFKEAMATWPEMLQETPEIINTQIEGKTGWDRMGEMTVQ